MFIVDVAFTLNVAFTQMLDKSGNSYYINIRHMHLQSQKQVAFCCILLCAKDYKLNDSYNKLFLYPNLQFMSSPTKKFTNKMKVLIQISCL